jgi:Leucine-rich repeat (LRR) protein
MSCSDKNATFNCNLDGCDSQYHCNTQTNQCEKSCTQTDCEQINQKCNENTGLCEPLCLINEDCDENSVCREEKCELFYVNIIDKNLDNCIKEELNISYDKKISLPQVEIIKNLECPNKKISDIKGISYLKNLENLSLWENDIINISEISQLSKLKSLQLGFNSIEDISPLINLNNLEKLSLSDNNIEDISTIRNLININWLNLDNNQIKNINFFINLTNLKWLTIENNPILDANTTISKLEENGVRVYFKIDNKKGEMGLNLMELTQNSKKINYKYPKIIPPEEYVRTTSETSYNRLEKFVLASPNQADAGSCLYMANTGAMEIILNQSKYKTEVENNNFQIPYDGDSDISERYLMNASNYASSVINYTMADLINTFNFHGGALLNSVYPFTVGWVKKDASGHRTASEEGVEGAEFTAEYNWIDQLPSNLIDMLTATPKVTRTILFLDPDLSSNSIWNVGLINDDVIQRIKYELRTKNAPVVVIYNHYLIWHTDIIVGYDDEAGFDTECPMVMDSIETFREKGNNTYADKIEAHIEAEGGCNKKGIFYVRDSIYDGDNDSPMYYYGNQGYEDLYSKKIIYHSYDWVKYLGNHVYSVHRSK